VVSNGESLLELVMSLSQSCVHYSPMISSILYTHV